MVVLLPYYTVVMDDGVRLAAASNEYDSNLCGSTDEEANRQTRCNLAV